MVDQGSNRISWKSFSEHMETRTSDGNQRVFMNPNSSVDSSPQPMKRGIWNPNEDGILAAYVNEHGDGSWKAVEKFSGLNRSAKSCRLRWTNHLRPNLKKGCFTPDEEFRVLDLHNKFGNKWARIAAEMPGRTDNDIKNYWNSMLRKTSGARIASSQAVMPANQSSLGETGSSSSWIEECGKSRGGSTFPDLRNLKADVDIEYGSSLLPDLE